MQLSRLTEFTLTSRMEHSPRHACVASDYQLDLPRSIRRIAEARWALPKRPFAPASFEKSDAGADCMARPDFPVSDA
jgi:hypothetical protein